MKEDKNIQSSQSGSAQNNAKKAALQAALSQIEKQFGKGSIMKMSDKSTENVEVISTGALSLDIALGVGGVPRGRIIEIFGPESSGKTTLALHIAAETQKNGGVVAYIDAEHALDPKYAKSIGVDVENMLISQPDYGEQALEIAETLVRSGAVDLIVVDSVAALTPKSEIEGEMGDAQIGVQARLMSQALRKLTAVANKSKTTVIFLNQIRMKIGVMFGNPETTTGGNALKFYASVRIEIRKGEKITDKDGNVIGNTVKVKVVKNKVAPPFRETEFDIIYPQGIDKYSSLISAAIDAGVIQKNAGWYKYEDKQLGNGKEAVKETLKNDAKLVKEIVEKTKSILLANK
ncbi:MAG: recombinase RecA [Candidatus Dojkabacteria bacterium]|nr:recombinase RecA [Candidatus Dojkabacteria bacterium]